MVSSLFIFLIIAFSDNQGDIIGAANRVYLDIINCTFIFIYILSLYGYIFWIVSAQFKKFMEHRKTGQDYDMFKAPERERQKILKELEKEKIGDGLNESEFLKPEDENDAFEEKFVAPVVDEDAFQAMFLEDQAADELAFERDFLDEAEAGDKGFNEADQASDYDFGDGNMGKKKKISGAVGQQSKGVWSKKF